MLLNSPLDIGANALPDLIFHSQPQLAGAFGENGLGHGRVRRWHSDGTPSQAGSRSHLQPVIESAHRRRQASSTLHRQFIQRGREQFPRSDPHLGTEDRIDAKMPVQLIGEDRGLPFLEPVAEDGGRHQWAQIFLEEMRLIRMMLQDHCRTATEYLCSRAGEHGQVGVGPGCRSIPGDQLKYRIIGLHFLEGGTSIEPRPGFQKVSLKPPIPLIPGIR